MKLNIAHFKKVSSDEHSSTLEHPAGHQIKVLHKPLSHEMLQQLHSLPQDGSIPRQTDVPKKPQKPPVWCKCDKENGDNPGCPIHKTEVNMSQGGETPNNPKLQQSKVNMADGGQVAQQGGGYKPCLNPNCKSHGKPHPNCRCYMAEGGEVKGCTCCGMDIPRQNLASGGDIDYSKADYSNEPTPASAPYGSGIPQATQQMPQDQSVTFNQPQAAVAPPAPQITPPNPQGDEAASAKKAMEPQVDPQMTGDIAKMNQDTSTIQQIAGMSNDPVGSKTFAQNAIQGVGQQLKGIQGTALGNQAQGAAEAESGRQLVKGASDQKDKTDAEFAPLAEETQSLVHDVMNPQVDSVDYQKVWHDKNILQKVSSGIGLILGGLGSGLTGGPNQALDFMNHQISASIDAQKANQQSQLGKAGAMNTLLGHLSQMYSPAIAAQIAKGQLEAIASAQLAQAAGTQKNQTALAIGNKLSGELKAQSAQTLGNAAAQLSNQRNGGPLPVDRVNALYQGKPEFSEAMKELGEAQNKGANRAKAMGAFDAFAQLSGPAGITLSPRERQNRLNLFNSNLPGLATNSGVDLAILKAHQPLITDGPTQLAEKRAAMDSEFTKGMHYPTLERARINPLEFGANPTQAAKLLPQQQQMLDWAKANPNNIKAQMVLKKLGQQ